MSDRLPLTLIAIKGPSSAKRDRLQFKRGDGSGDDIEMPRQGILPHDLVHALVEQGFDLVGGFLSMVAAGASPQFLLSKDLPKTAASGIAESVVEAMQTQLAQGHFDYEAFLYGAQTACASRDIDTLPHLDADQAQAIFQQAIALNEQWRPLKQTDTLTLNVSFKR